MKQIQLPTNRKMIRGDNYFYGMPLIEVYTNHFSMDRMPFISLDTAVKLNMFISITLNTFNEVNKR